MVDKPFEIPRYLTSHWNKGPSQALLQAVDDSGLETWPSWWSKATDFERNQRKHTSFFNLLILKEVASPNHPIPITQSTPEKAPLYESEKYRQISHKTKVLLSALIGWLRVFLVGPVFHLLTLVACWYSVKNSTPSVIFGFVWKWGLPAMTNLW